MNQERILNTILAPHMSEKAAINTQNSNVYVFQVCQKATKPQVKEAIESLFKTKVEVVRIVNVKSKPKRFGSIKGSSKAWKKAYVTLQAGQQIEIAVAK